MDQFPNEPFSFDQHNKLDVIVEGNEDYGQTSLFQQYNMWSNVQQVSDAREQQQSLLMAFQDDIINYAQEDSFTIKNYVIQHKNTDAVLLFFNLMMLQAKNKLVLKQENQMLFGEILVAGK